VYSCPASKHGPETVTDVPPRMCPQYGRIVRSVVSTELIL